MGENEKVKRKRYIILFCGVFLIFAIIFMIYEPKKKIFSMFPNKFQ